MEGSRKKIDMHNCHIHTFLYTDVPEKFLRFRIIRSLAKRVNWLARFLNNLDRSTDSDVYDRYANFIRLINCPNQEAIFHFIKHFYPTNTNYVILSMDMNFMGAGDAPRKFEAQLDELTKLKKTYPNNVFPFICVDPRRNNALSLVKDYIEKHDFCGLKLYPPLGYFPYDSNLFPIYEYAEKRGIPIIAHCSKSGPIFSKLKKHELKSIITAGFKQETGITLDLENKNARELCNYFTHPWNYKIVFEKFPHLKICLAHFGGGSQWEKFLNPSTVGVCEKKKKKMKHIREEASWFDLIYDMLKIHKNLYTDISFTLENRDYLALLKIILKNPQVNEQILFGSDFYMTETKTSERSFGVDLHGYLGTELFTLIAEENPKKFLSNCLYKSLDL